LIVISPHGDVSFDNFTVNTSQEYVADFKKFGDFSTKLNFKSDLHFINQLRSFNETKLPMQLICQDTLDHGATVPLYYLTRKNKNRRVVPINYSYLSQLKHVEFGESIKEAIYSLDKRYAVIASGDLSHRLTVNAPAGFSPRAKEFDKKIIQLLKKKNWEAVLNLDQIQIEDAAECGLRAILILLGIIKNMQYDFQVLNYESPFGVGYLVGEYKID